MMNLPSLSPKTIAHIARGASSFEQHYPCQSDWWCDCRRYVVTYPNGYGASIFTTSLMSEALRDEDEIWEVAFLNKNGDIYEDAEGMDQTWSFLTEKEVIRVCDYIYFFE